VRTASGWCNDLARVYEKEWRKKYEGSRKEVNEILPSGACTDDV
jgi:hypothetical protein